MEVGVGAAEAAPKLGRLRQVKPAVDIPQLLLIQRCVRVRIVLRNSNAFHLN
jgi:hypothetical protein